MALFFNFFLFHVFLLSYVSPELTMMLVWGRPTSSTDADINETLTWDECVDQCFTAQRCVLAWQNGSSCVNYDYNTMGSVTQTSSANKSIVAFKVESPDGTCPVGDDAPTFNGTNAPGSLYCDDDPLYFPKWVYYNISLNGDTWDISFKNNFSCLGGSGIITRSDGSGVCASTWYSANSLGFFYNTSLGFCTNKTQTLASLYYPEDLEYWNETGADMKPYLNYSSAYARLDGIRTATCQETPTTAACMGVSGFTFTGTPPTNFDYYNWVTNSGAQATADDNCIVMVFNGTNAGKTDVRSCVTTSPLQSLLVYCGAPAWIYS